MVCCRSVQTRPIDGPPGASARYLAFQSALLDAELVTLDEVMFPWMVGGPDGQTAFVAFRSQQKAIG